MKKPLSVLLCHLLVGLAAINPASADILTTRFFAGTIQRFNEATKAQTTFATIAGNPGLSGIAYNPVNNRVYVSALNHGGIYVLDAASGIVVGVHLLGIGPGGLAVGPTGNVYVTDFTSNLVRVYDPTFSLPPATISVPVAGVTSGVGLLANGHVLIATAGSGVFRYDGVTVTPFTANPAAQISSAQIAADSANNIFIGHGLGFSDSALKFNSTGTVVGAITVTDTMVGGTGSGSSSGTSPSGLAFDRDGNIFVAALGRSNPGDPGGERGGLFKFDVNGNLLDTFATASSAFSAVAVLPAVVKKAFVFHGGWSGSGSAIDSVKQLHKQGTVAATLTYNNLINTTRGINGVGFDVQDLADPAALSASDFEFRMSPQFVFNEVDHPPATWVSAPAPSMVNVTAGAIDQVLIHWLDNQIENRWLRITIKANAKTGLLKPEVYYLGHLRGETTGDTVGGVYSVQVLDILQVRSFLAASPTSESTVDIDKNGAVQVADMVAVRSNLAKQLRNITVP